MTFYVSGKPVACLAMAVLGGCAAYSIEQPTIAMVAPGDERIVFAADDFKGTTPVHVKFTDPWQREDYALFQGNGAQAEILYSAARTVHQVALEDMMRRRPRSPPRAAALTRSPPCARPWSRPSSAASI